MKKNYGKNVPGNSAINIHSLTKIFPNGTKALDNASLEIKDDDFLIILGPSGAGKSTLLRCLNRLVEPTAGHIILHGNDITHLHGTQLRDVRGRVGMIFQQFNLVRRMTVLENVLAGRLRFCRPLKTPLRFLGSLCKHFPGHEKEFAFECLRKVGIETLAFQRADTLSGGQQQRVAIARSLAQEPEVFLADEPIASLDPASAEKVMDTLVNIHESQKIPVIINLHHIDLAERYAKKIVGMKNGRIVYEKNSSHLTRDTIRLIYGDKIDVERLNLKGEKDIIQSPVSPPYSGKINEYVAAVTMS